MKVKTAELKDAALDWAVLLAKNATAGVDLAKTYVGADGRKYLLTSGGFTVNFLDWLQGGPLLEEGKIQVSFQRNGLHAGQWGLLFGLPTSLARLWRFSNSAPLI